jgi:hypothetical protein
MTPTMTDEHFQAFRLALRSEAWAIADDKARTYASTEDRLSNFSRGAARYGMTPEQTLGIYLGKHMDSIEAYIRSGIENREGVLENIRDACNYLELLAAMVHARKNPQ